MLAHLKIDHGDADADVRADADADADADAVADADNIKCSINISATQERYWFIIVFHQSSLF